MFGKDNENKIELLKKEIEDIQDILDVVGNDLKFLKEKRELSNDLGARVAELELKMSKLWSMLLETTPTGKQKLSTFGRKFGGMSKHNSR